MITIVNTDSCDCLVGGESLTDEQLAQISGFATIDDIVYNLGKKGFEVGCFGFEDKMNNLFDQASSLLHLKKFFEMIYNQMLFDDNAGCRESMQTYLDRHGILCIRDYFKCKGIDIKNLALAYGINLSGKELNGIGYMTIEGDPNCPTEPIFTIK